MLKKKIYNSKDRNSIESNKGGFMNGIHKS